MSNVPSTPSKKPIYDMKLYFFSYFCYFLAIFAPIFDTLAISTRTNLAS